MRQIQELLSERKAARDVIDREVRALERCLADLGGRPIAKTNGVASTHMQTAVPKRGRIVSPAERERARQRMKRYWREKKRAQRAAAAK